MTPTFRTSQPGSAADPSQAAHHSRRPSRRGKIHGGPAVADTTRAHVSRPRCGDRASRRTLGRPRSSPRRARGISAAKERELTEELRLVGNMILAPGGGWIGAILMSLRCYAPLDDSYTLECVRRRPLSVWARIGRSGRFFPVPIRLANWSVCYRERRAAYEAADRRVDTELYGLQRVIERCGRTCLVWWV